MNPSRTRNPFPTKIMRAALAGALAFVFGGAFADAAAPGTAVDVPVLTSTPSMNGSIDSSWSTATKLTLNDDLNFRRPAAEPTTVYVAQENGYLDVAFAVTQSEALTQTQETNGSSVQNDDYVAVALSPQGTHGYNYAFYANPRGARFQTSSENTAYSPQWVAGSTRTPTGYGVTMRIPLNVIRNGGSTDWQAQFERLTIATNALDLWTYSPSMSNAGDPTFFGMLRKINAQAQAQTRPQPRIQPYVLGELTPKAEGGNTSRIGLDAALPIAPTASLVASLHPDYSNVEIDQQTIAPTAFQRQYQEVRPFFTQTASFFDDWFSCNNCPDPLYTPVIPTFAQGYAVEGTQGPLTYAAFDAIGDGRSDNAQAVNYLDENQVHLFQANLQRVGVDAPGLVDGTTTLDLGYLNQLSHLGAYANIGIDRGTLVTDPQQANYFEGGPLYVGPTTIYGIDYQRVGAQFNPVDGYVQQTNIAGYQVFGKKIFNFSAQSVLHDIYTLAFFTRYGNDQNQLAQATWLGQVNVDFRDLFTVRLISNSQGIRASNGELLPFDGNSVTLGYRMGNSLINGGSTTTNTPSYITYTGGPYYHGKLDAWTYLTTQPLVRHLNLTLETDEDRYDTFYPGETSSTQWLERASLDWQINRYAELDFGVRRIVGANLPNSFQTLAQMSPGVCFENPYYPGCMVDAGNVSLAFHFLAERNEFYVVYGNPNSLATYPALFVKWIRYIGAEKGQ